MNTSDWEIVAGDVLAEVLAERRAQVRKGWTPEHDDRMATYRMVEVALEHLDKPGRKGEGYYDRQHMVEGIAVLVAAVEAMDRYEAKR